MRRKWWVLRNQEGGGDGSAGGSGAGASGAGADGSGGAAAGGAGAAAGSGAAAGGAGAGAGGAAADQSLFASVGQGGAADASAGGDTGAAAAGDAETPETKALKAAEKDTRRPQHVPAKFWNAQTGEVNYEAWSKSTSELETRMRTVGLPPKAADEYKFEAPQQLRDMGLDLDPDRSKGFRDKALELGLTQKQYEGVMGLYFGEVESLAEHSARVGSERLKSDLIGHYKTAEVMGENVKLALSVVQAYGDEQEVAAAMGPQGNTPAWVYRVLAKVGKELQEDPGVHGDAILSAESLDELMKGKPGDQDSPYWNPKHPQHKTVVEKVQRHHAAATAARQRKAA